MFNRYEKKGFETQLDDNLITIHTDMLTDVWSDRLVYASQSDVHLPKKIQITRRIGVRDVNVEDRDWFAQN